MRKTNLSLALIVLLGGNVYAGDLQDANKIFNWAEDSLPELFTPARPPTTYVFGFITRYYSTTEVALGTKDGWVYGFGERFGGLVNFGAVDYYLNLIDGSGGAVTVDVTGRWVGSGSSDIYPGCSASLDVQLVQTGNTINGNGTMNAPCLGGSYAGTITGTVNGSRITFGMAGDASSQIYYQGNIAADQARANGTYDWPDEDDEGTWALRRQ